MGVCVGMGVSWHGYDLFWVRVGMGVRWHGCVLAWV